MMKQITLGLMAAVLTLTTQVAMAGPDCTSEPKDQWLSMLDMQKKIVNEYGYTMLKFKETDGNCYEIYGYAPKEGATDEMQKVEIYFNPLDGAEVKKKIED